MTFINYTDQTKLPQENMCMSRSDEKLIAYKM